MDRNAEYARALAALGHETRLRIFRLLVRAGNEGLNVGEIRSLVAVPMSTLVHHLSHLVDAGLVVQERRGREVVNRPEFETMRQTLSFLTDECCTGVALESDDAA